MALEPSLVALLTLCMRTIYYLVFRGRMSVSNLLRTLPVMQPLRLWLC